MDMTLVLTSDQLADDALQALTIHLCNQIRKEAHIEARPVVGDATPGQKGDPVTLGAITLAIVSSGTAVALFEVIKSIFNRDKSVLIKIEHDDGRVITISGKNLNRDQFNQLMGIGN